MIARTDAADNDLAFLRGGGEAGARIAAYDWASTPIGPIAAWPEWLKAATSLLLPSPTPIMLLLGVEGIVLHNDAQSRLMGEGNEHALGAPARKAWPEHADFVEEMLAAGLTGRTLSAHKQRLRTDPSGRRELAWFDIDCSPVRDARGESAGVFIVSVEATRRVFAEHKAARKLELQRAMFEQAPGFICQLTGPDLVVEFTNAAHRELFGVPDPEGKPYSEAYRDVIALNRPEILTEVYETGKGYVARAERVLIPRRGGPPRAHLLDFVVEPVFDDAGHVQGLFLQGFDVTDQVQAQNAAEQSSRRLGAALALARLGAFEWDADADQVILDARTREIYGFGADEAVTREEILGRIDDEDRARIYGEARAADADGRNRREFEYRVRRPDGSVRRVANISEVLLAPDGMTFQVIGLIDDVTERRASERRQRMLINELNHRVKNTLATVQSIAAQTLRAAPTVASAREDFESRLVALAAAHDLLTAECWRGAPLADVVATALAPFEPADLPRIRRGGPHVRVAAEHALALNLALHELATNAAKYGALSATGGVVDLSWALCGDQLTLQWVEHDGPPVAARTRAGFGARLLQRSLARELGGEVDWTFPTRGVRCEIRCRIGGPTMASPVEIAEAAAAKFEF